MVQLLPPITGLASSCKLRTFLEALEGAMALVQSSGKVTFLRVHNVGSRFGPPADQIDVEVVTKLSSQPTRAMGFQLRNDSHRPARQGMFDLLREAFTHNLTVTIDYDLPAGKQNGVATRVALTK